MKYAIHRAAVIGSGVMGSGIAAHLANAGLQVDLFDVSEQLAKNNRHKLLSQKPAPLYHARQIERITPRSLKDDGHVLSEADWIIEAIIEDLSAKKDLLARIEQHLSPHTIVSSNTSGLSITQMIYGRGERVSEHFLGTHFFNPPRYLKLLEIIPHEHTDTRIVTFMQEFARNYLGKGVVIAKDTPNFIANRIGCYGLMVTLDVMKTGGYSIGEVDSVTGVAMGRPKSATFRTMDIVGLDTFAHVADTVRDAVQDQIEQERFILPAFVQDMLQRQWLGEKTGQGFYKKVRGKQGSEILELDREQMTYIPSKKIKAPSLQQSKNKTNVSQRLQTVIYAQDRAGELAWAVTKKVLLYSASKLGEIADDIVSIDQAMRWGFGWELGPFELWDAIGLHKSVQRMKDEGELIPSWIEEMLAQGLTGFYVEKATDRLYVSALTVGNTPGTQKEHLAFIKMVEQDESISLSRLKKNGQLIKKNAGASLIDLGDGVACLEFQSPNNAIGVDILHMIHMSLEEVGRNYEGLVIGNQGKHFCVGANLMFILMEAQEMNWSHIEAMIRQFQEATSAIRYSRKPVVVAPFGMSLGGGTEFCLPASRLQASAETYMGLVELGVGIIPGGGGNKEMLYRFYDSDPAQVKVDLQELVNVIFETIAMAKVSTSAEDARQYGYVRPQDGVSMYADHLLYDAKQSVLSLTKSGYQPPQPRQIPVVGEPGRATLKLGAYSYKAGGYISEHDYIIAQKLAYVLSGGNVPAGKLVGEQYLLDIEREAFMSLVGEPKTQQRMQHMLSKGKPLRN